MILKRVLGARIINRPVKGKKVFQRAVLVFLCFCLVFSAVEPVTVSALAQPATKQKQTPKPLLSNQELKHAPAADAKGGTSLAPNMGAGEKPQQKKKEDRTHVREETEKRTSASKTFLNKDGTKTMEYSVIPKHYQKNGKWLDLNPTTSEDKEFKTTKKLVDEPAFSNPFASKPQSFKTKAGEFTSTLKPFQDGIEVQYKDKKFTFAPQAARNVRPTSEIINDHEIITYKNAWPDVDVTYELVGNALKETLILKNKKARSSFTYKVSDGTSVSKHPTIDGALAIEGIDPKEFFIAPLSVNVNKRGIISDQRASWDIKDKDLTLKLDAKWYDSLKDSDFPIAIDPSFYNDVGGTYGNFIAYKSDGYSCNSQICDPQAGGLNDNGAYKAWRTMFRIPFDQLQGGKKVLSASLHLVKKQRNYWTGYDGWRYIHTSWAPCFGYGCTHGDSYTAGNGANTNDWTNVTNTVDWMVKNGQWGGWFIMLGDEGQLSYKQFEPTSLGMSVVYDTPTPQATPIEPADNQVVVDTQPTLRVGGVGDPDSDGVTYKFTISTSRSSTAGVIASSDFTDSTQWTVPDNILQDGTTYYWSVTTRGATETAPNWFNAIKIDMRTGKDSTQAYDTIGPMSIDLATGNATTSIGTHSMSALGGSIGLNFDYNSPTRSRKGLVGEYYNNTTHSGNPVLTRVDRNVDFAWSTGSPYSGLVATDNFSAKWSGYFTAPVAGNYEFGGVSDDAMTIVANEQTVLNQGCCSLNYGGVPLTLAAGQTIPISVKFSEIGGAATAQLFVKSPGVAGGQIVPSEWLQTGVRPVSQPYGLTGRYYKDDGSHNFPTSQDDTSRLLMVRKDSTSSMNWGQGAPAPGLQADNFMVRWKGYLTIPSTATAGAYTFGGSTDDGMRMKLGIGTGGADVTVYDKYVVPAGTAWSGSTHTLTPGQQVPITIEYFEVGGAASMEPWIRGPGLPDQVIPTSWLSSTAQVLPGGWQLGVDVDGDINYERITVNTSTAVLSDSSGTTHEYTWTGSGYKPPVNEGGILTKGADGKYTLTDVDGRIYVFNLEGKLESVTSPQDDRQPAALKYEYAGNPSRLMKITDGVTATRYATLHYKGLNEDGNCSTASGFDAAPTGMLCAFKTSDGDVTKIYYKDGQLARMEKPGAEMNDYGYDTLGRIVSQRDTVANDVLASGVRPDNAELTTELSYDAIGRGTAIKAPAPTEGSARNNHTFDYIPGGAGQLSAVSDAGVNPTDTPVSISWGGDRIDQFSRGTASDLIHRAYVNGAWTSWGSLGGCIWDSPTVSSWAVGRLDVFARGCSTTAENLYHRAFDNGQWHAWSLVPTGGVNIISSPSAVSWGYQRIDYALRGSNGQLYHGAWTPQTGWTTPGTLGGCISTAPRIVSTGHGNLDIYGLACTTTADNVVVRSYRPVSGWAPYFAVPGIIATDLGANYSPASGTLLAARQLDGNLKMQKIGTNSWQSIAACTTGAPSLSTQNSNVALFYTPCGTQTLSQQTYFTSAGSSQLHIVGAPEPHGFSKKVEYDTLFRTIKETDLANLSSTTEWDPIKDLQLSSTDATGLKSTTIYDDDDRAVENYGPAPAAWFGADRRPLTANANQVPKTTTGYDEGMTGLAVSYMASNAPQPTNILNTGQTMIKGQSLWSLDNRFHFTYQHDGNIVLYGPNGVMWTAATAGKASTGLVMQSDGNLVLYNGGTAVWWSGTNAGNSNAHLMIQNDGNAVVYRSNGSTWSTETGGWGTAGPSSSSLTGTPLMRGTNIATDGTISKNFGETSPIPNRTGSWGMSMTGKMRLPTAGNWNFRIWSDNGVRVWIDDVIVQDDWHNSPQRSHPTFTYNNVTANSIHRVRIEYYHTAGPAVFTLYATPPGGSETANVAQYFSPGYGLTTSQTAYDSQQGNVTTTTTYNKPEYGLVDRTTLDPTGLNLQTTSTYEAPGAGFLRQTSKTLPGGGTTNYQHYGAEETKDNPCTTATEAFHQAGRPKGKTEADPDGAGSQTGRTNETIYNESGETVATRYNNDPWTCTEYDTRGRVSRTIIPQLGQYQPARTITNNYAVDNNPLITGTTDSTGTITVENDLLGRTVRYVDVHDNVTTSTYTAHGLLASRSGPLGGETFVYDQYDRLVDQKLDNTTYAHVTYDQYGRTDNVSYPAAGQQKVQYSRDILGRTNGLAYTVASSSTQGSNLIANPSHEQSSGTPAAPTAWTSNAWGTNTPVLSYENTGRTGGKSLKTELTAYTDGDAKWMFTPVTATANTNYTYTDYYKSNVSTSVIAQYTHQDNSVTWSYLGENNASSSWAQGSYSFTTPATIAKVSIVRIIDKVGWVQIDDVDMHQTTVPSATTTISDTITHAVSGDIVSGVENGTTKSYTYDNAGRLTGATIGSNTFSYEFGTPASGCSGLAGNNPNAGKNGNRTKLTMNGQATTYCYDNADRLISSSDSTLNDIEYDAHGNTTRLNATLRPVYDASDRNRGIEEYDASGNGKAVYYERDAQDRIVSRHQDNIVNWDWQPNGTTLYGFTGSGDTPDFTKDASGVIKEKYLLLPGDVLMTVRPQQSGTGQKTYSLPNIHDDIFATTNANGELASTHITGPFGEPITGQTNPNNTTQDTTFGYVGQHEKITETSFNVQLTQMGARVYVPTIGRFLGVDPIPGAGDNAYSYVNDPVNENDLDGKIAPIVAFAAWQLGRLAVQQTIKIAAQHAARQAAQQVIKKAAVQQTKKTLQWSAGKSHNAVRNATTHYSKHAREIGARTQKAYNNSARNTITRSIDSHKYRNGRTAFLDARGRISVVNNRGRLVSHYSPKSQKLVKHWTNIKRR